MFSLIIWPDTVYPSGLYSCMAFQTPTINLLRYMPDEVRFLAGRVISGEWPIGTRLHKELELLSNIACLVYPIKLSQIYRQAHSHPSWEPGRF